ncbi:MAG TPA: FAD-dependent oxidoreductase, partial [Acidimicrobiales bacterium]|nr:FAD-dependent oxidoreductase [Acidimicrobiales bacterium]
MVRMPRVVVVGGGFGGLAVVRALLRDGADVVLVDRNNFHTFQPLLYQVATAGLDAENVAATLRGIFAGRPHFDFHCGDVTSVDLDARQVMVGEHALPYEWLVLAPGSTSSSFGIPGVDEHAFTLKTLGDAIRLRSHVLRRFEEASADPALVDRGHLTFVVV